MTTVRPAPAGTAKKRPTQPYLRRLDWRHPEWPLTVLAGVAWILTIGAHRASHAGAVAAVDGGVPWTTDAAAVLIMATAMMLPAALPAARDQAITSRWRRRHRSAAIFGLSFLFVWACFVAVVVALAHWLAPAMPSGRATLVLLVVLAAGWEMLPIKGRLLLACHRVRALPQHGWRAEIACTAAGLQAGVVCVAACWALMLLMAFGGPSLLLMLGLSAAVFAERILRRGPFLHRYVAALLFGVAALIIIAP